jgi:uncharacterized protein YlxW (UPF0749 family)
MTKRFFFFKVSELNSAQRRSNELASRISELEEALNRTQRDFARAQEANSKLQRDLRENVAQKVDQVCSKDKIYALFRKIFFF